MAKLYFSDYFGVSPVVLKNYGAFNISIASDLPLFIDPFLLFHSKKPEYQDLHSGIIKYLIFLRDHATKDLDPALIKSWFMFKEVKQNWLGFTLMGNGGHGLGKDFADNLHRSLWSILADFGNEKITRGSHLEKLSLIRDGVGRDNISDFTTNLMKQYLLEYTEAFARDHLEPKMCGEFSVTRAAFNYVTEAWETRKYFLPRLGNDFVLLTPADLLTRDDTWISHADMIRHYDQLPASVSDVVLRGQINNYFGRLLSTKPTQKERKFAAKRTIEEFPILVDLYIRNKEDTGEDAEILSDQRRTEIEDVLVNQVQLLVSDLDRRSSFYSLPFGSYSESLVRVKMFKDYVENKDGYKLINKGKGQPFSNESEVQIYFGLVWCGSDYDFNREVNNGRGSVDFKVSMGSKDKSLIEFKLASNRNLKRNLENQVQIYEAANGTHQSVKVIIFYTEEEGERVAKILKELGLSDDDSIVLVDARSDNKPSASRA